MTQSATETGPPCLKPTRAAIAQAARVIRQGGLVGLPTDTVYGLAADATDDDAVAGVFRAKGRPPDKPLIALVATLAMAEACADFSCARIARLPRHFGPVR